MTKRPWGAIQKVSHQWAHENIGRVTHDGDESDRASGKGQRHFALFHDRIIKPTQSEDTQAGTDNSEQKHPKHSRLNKVTSQNQAPHRQQGKTHHRHPSRTRSIG